MKKKRSFHCFGNKKIPTWPWLVPLGDIPKSSQSRVKRPAMRLLASSPFNTFPLYFSLHQTLISKFSVVTSVYPPYTFVAFSLRDMMAGLLKPITEPFKRQPSVAQRVASTWIFQIWRFYLIWLLRFIIDDNVWENFFCSPVFVNRNWTILSIPQSSSIFLLSSSHRVMMISVILMKTDE